MIRKTCTYEMFLMALRGLEGNGVEPTYAAITTWLCEHEGIRVSASTIRGFKQQQATLAKPVEPQLTRVTTAGTAREAIVRALDDVANTVAAALLTIERTVDSELLACREASVKEFIATAEEIRSASARQIDALNQELESTIRELDAEIERNSILTEAIRRLQNELDAAHTRLDKRDQLNSHLLAKLGLMPPDDEMNLIEEESADAPTALQVTDDEANYQTMVVDPDPAFVGPFPPAGVNV